MSPAARPREHPKMEPLAGIWASGILRTQANDPQCVTSTTTGQPGLGYLIPVVSLVSQPAPVLHPALLNCSHCLARRLRFYISADISVRDSLVSTDHFSYHWTCIMLQYYWVARSRPGFGWRCPNKVRFDGRRDVDVSHRTTGKFSIYAVKRSLICGTSS